MQRVSLYFLIKGCIALAILIIGGAMLWNGSSSLQTLSKITFILSLESGMNTADIPTAQGEMMTRLQASVQCIQDSLSLHPSYSFGIITQGEIFRYLIPPTQDTGAILQYAQSILTEGSLPKAVVWTSGMQIATQDTRLVCLAYRPDGVGCTPIIGKALLDCKKQSITPLGDDRYHLSSLQQQAMLRGLIGLVVLLLC